MRILLLNPCSWAKYSKRTCTLKVFSWSSAGSHLSKRRCKAGGLSSHISRIPVHRAFSWALAISHFLQNDFDSYCSYCYKVQTRPTLHANVHLLKLLYIIYFSSHRSRDSYVTVNCESGYGSDAWCGAPSSNISLGELLFQSGMVR